MELLLCVPVLIAIALLLAIVLSETIRGHSFFRGVLFFPYILPVTVVGAPGVVGVRCEPEAGDAELVPIAFVAFTVKV